MARVSPAHLPPESLLLVSDDPALAALLRAAALAVEQRPLHGDGAGPLRACRHRGAVIDLRRDPARGLDVLTGPGTRVALSYRGQGFARVKPRNREALDRAVAAGGIEVLLGSEVLSIGARQVQLRGPQGEALERAADAVIVCAGGELPVPLLKSVGVHFETKFGTA